MKHTAKLILAGFLMLSPMLAQAQDEGSESERQACEADVNSTCKDAIPDRPRIIQCLSVNVRRLSPPCANVIRFYTQQRFCAPDASRYCPDFPASDREGVVRCLQKSQSKVGSNCRNALRSFLAGSR